MKQSLCALVADLLVERARVTACGEAGGIPTLRDMAEHLQTIPR
jgi:hypothetical protein